MTRFSSNISIAFAVNADFKSTNALSLSANFSSTAPKLALFSSNISMIFADNFDFKSNDAFFSFSNSASTVSIFAFEATLSVRLDLDKADSKYLISAF